MKIPIYLDYAATTPIDPRVVDAMLPFLAGPAQFGNAASTHAFGQIAHLAIEHARQEVADLLHASPQEIIWTSGATEANNLALKGITTLYPHKGNHIITMKTEHPSVMDCCHFLEKQGFLVTYLTPEKNGLLDLNKLQDALRKETILVSIMHVNNEIGTIQAMQEIAELTAARGIFLHVDAAQSAGKVGMNVQDTPVDLISLCAHKVYGPKGIGALYMRRKPRVRVAALLHGGGHEQGMRSGTLPVHQIVGMGKAFAIAQQEMDAEQKRLRVLREQFLQGLASVKNMKINGESQFSSPGILNICFGDVMAEQLIERLPELAFSSGSACHAKKIATSYVLRALGLTEQEARSSVRFSFGRFTTENEIESAVAAIKKVAHPLLQRG